MSYPGSPCQPIYEAKNPVRDGTKIFGPINQSTEQMFMFFTLYNIMIKS
jgi:hypothetical protein